MTDASRAFPNTSLIHGPSSMLTLLGRGWKLFKSNIRICVLIMMLPAILFSAFSLIISLPGTVGKFMSLSNSVAYSIFQGVLGFLLGIGGFLFSAMVALIAVTLLIRFFYYGYIKRTSLSIYELLGFIFKKPLILFFLYSVVIFLTFAFFALDIIAVFFLFFTGGIITTALSGLVAAASGLAGLSIIVMVVMVFIAAVSIFFVGSFQYFIVFFPFSAIIISDGTDIVKGVKSSIRLLGNNFFRVCLYGAMLLFIGWLISMVFHFPVHVWAGFELYRLGTLGQVINAETIPVYVSIVYSLWSNLVSVIVFPYLVGASFLFWYDCKVRSEGADIQDKLDRLLKGSFNSVDLKKEVKQSAIIESSQ